MKKPGCYNRPIPGGKPLVVQNGYREYVERGHPVKIPVYVEIPHAMTTDCQWSKHNRDRSCQGCRWKAKTTGRANQVS